MPQFSVTLAKIAEGSNLTTLYAAKDLSETKVITAEVYRPGIMLAGYYQYFDNTRIQIIGLTELSYLQELEPEVRRTHLEKLFSFQPPCVILTRDLEPLPEMLEFAKKYSVPLLRSTEMTSPLMSSLITTLNTELAPRITRHGVLVEVAGEGILILGDSGVGKSETAIELVKRGHRLVADDAVDIRRVSDQLIGKAPELIRHYIELRGIGVIDVQQLFGMSAVILEAQIDLVVHLEQWREDKFYDRFGLDEETVDILGVELPILTIPVMPGRNLAVIVEVAAMNNRHKKYGYNAAQKLAEELERHAQGM